MKKNVISYITIRFFFNSVDLFIISFSVYLARAIKMEKERSEFISVYIIMDMYWFLLQLWIYIDYSYNYGHVLIFLTIMDMY